MGFFKRIFKDGFVCGFGFSPNRKKSCVSEIKVEPPLRDFVVEILEALSVCNSENVKTQNTDYSQIIYFKNKKFKLEKTYRYTSGPDFQLYGFKHITFNETEQKAIREAYLELERHQAKVQKAKEQAKEWRELEKFFPNCAAKYH